MWTKRGEGTQLPLTRNSGRLKLYHLNITMVHCSWQLVYWSFLKLILWNIDFWAFNWQPHYRTGFFGLLENQFRIFLTLSLPVLELKNHLVSNTQQFPVNSYPSIIMLRLWVESSWNIQEFSSSTKITSEFNFASYKTQHTFLCKVGVMTAFIKILNSNHALLRDGNNE